MLYLASSLLTHTHIQTGRQADNIHTAAPDCVITYVGMYDKYVCNYAAGAFDRRSQPSNEVFLVRFGEEEGSERVVGRILRQGRTVASVR